MSCSRFQRTNESCEAARLSPRRSCYLEREVVHKIPAPLTTICCAPYRCSCAHARYYRAPRTIVDAIRDQYRGDRGATVSEQVTFMNPGMHRHRSGSGTVRCSTPATPRSSCSSPTADRMKPAHIIDTATGTDCVTDGSARRSQLPHRQHQWRS